LKNLASTWGLTVPATGVFVIGICLAACSAPSQEALAERDPWEATNRDVFDFDIWVEHNVARPVDDGYRAVVPEPAREGVHNITSNLHEPIVLANDVLQGDAKKAVKTLGRIVINSTVGLGGLIDVAAKIGMPYHDNDFGITLGQNGIQEGSYLVLPFVGPMPPRDLLGSAVDGVFEPFSYARFTGKSTLLLIRSGLRVVDTVDKNRDELDNIERTSLDFYATTRNLYRQNRDARIRGENAIPTDLPDL
jgi:phospholipid-binding lipoprotein MlaA